MKETKNSSKIKKIRPYPFSVMVSKEGQSPVRCQIVKLTEVGFLMQVREHQIFKVGDNYFAEFDVPKTEVTVKESMIIVKTYDNYDNQAETNKDGNKDKIYTIEMHFKNLNFKSRSAIQSFKTKIGQK